MFKINDKFSTFLGIQLKFIFSGPLFNIRVCILDMAIRFTLDNFRYGCVMNEYPATNILEL